MYFKSRVLSSLLVCISLLIAAPISIASQEAVDPELYCKQWVGHKLQVLRDIHNSGAKEFIRAIDDTVASCAAEVRKRQRVEL